MAKEESYLNYLQGLFPKTGNILEQAKTSNVMEEQETLYGILEGLPAG